MIIQVIAFESISNYPMRKRRDAVVRILNETTADLVLFPGGTLKDNRVLKYVAQKVRTKCTTLIEVSDWVEENEKHLFLMQNGKVVDLHTCQQFAQSSEAGKKNTHLLLHEELPKRLFVCSGHSVTVLQCGENNIITTPQSENYKPRFRHEDDKELKVAYRIQVRNVDIVLNPMHTRQKRHFIERCQFLSRNGYYFGTANADDRVGVNHQIFAYHNGHAILPSEPTPPHEGYVSNLYIIE